MNSCEDVRATEKDKIEIDKCFRPGDIIRAEVVINFFIFYFLFFIIYFYFLFFIFLLFYFIFFFIFFENKKLSLGDKKHLFLTTNKNEYGVIFAKSIAGSILVPISWQEMQCPSTKMKEFRKVAKIN